MHSVEHYAKELGLLFKVDLVTFDFYQRAGSKLGWARRDRVTVDFSSDT